MKSDHLALTADLGEALDDGPIESYSENWMDFDSFSDHHLVHATEPTTQICVQKGMQNLHWEHSVYLG